LPSWALQQEFDLVEQATFTDPEDQSAWIYHRWLLSQLMAHHEAASTTDKQHVARQVCRPAASSPATAAMGGAPMSMSSQCCIACIK
jgi:geranylgeranyl transferase type-2 subunit alpha